jgi:hypothetical protein
MRPAIDGWFDATLTIYRATVVQDALATEQRVYSVFAAGVGTRVNRSRTPIAPAPAGLAPTGIIRMYLRPDVDVRHRDIILVMTGPDSDLLAPRMWEVNELPVRPGGHHTQIDCIEWHGTLTEAPVS